MRHWPQKPPLGVPLNGGHPLSRGLVGCWLMNEGGGNKVSDLSGNSGAGDFLADTSWSAGIFGPAVYLDGNRSGIETSKTTFVDADFGTVVVWVLTTNATKDQVIYAGGDSGDDSRLYFTWGYGTSKFGMRFGDDSLIESDDTFSLSWHQVAITFVKNGSVRLYVDGKLAKSGTHSSGTLGNAD